MGHVDVRALFDEPVAIGKLPDALLAAGVHAFTTEDAAAIAGVKLESARPALARLLKHKTAFSPARGLYVPVPPQYRSWGAVPASWFVDALMTHLGRSYYVGYLSAAEVHGAAHQRPQVFQVVVDRALRERAFERVRLRFITNQDTACLPTVRRNTPTGTMAVSTPELTALDLAGRPDHGGALHNVATVLVDLGRRGQLGDDALSTLARRFPVAAGRRLGWIVEHHTEARLDALAKAVSTATGEPSRLDPHGPRRGRVDRRWSLRLNAAVDPEL